MPLRVELRQRCLQLTLSSCGDPINRIERELLSWNLKNMLIQQAQLAA